MWKPKCLMLDSVFIFNYVNIANIYDNAESDC